MVPVMLEKLSWLGHATFRLDDEAILYIDPWKLDDKETKAGVILVSHTHYDHFSSEDIEKISRKGTRLITTADVAKAYPGESTVIKPGETVDAAPFKITATHAYNIGKKFHPKENGWVGFLIEAPSGTLFYAGDTDLIPEFEELKQVQIDVALLPVGGTYTMNAAEAVEAAKTIEPELAVPYHFGDIVGTGTDARQFESEYPGRSKVLVSTHQ